MKMKKLLSVLSTAIFVLALAGCGTTVDNSGNEDKNSGTGNESTGIVEGSVVPSLAEKAEGSHQYVFAIKNDKTEDITLTMNSSQYFDYQLLDDAGTVQYTYSADKQFTQMLEEKVLKPGEILEMPFDLTEGLNNLPAGTYQLDVWSTANEMKDVKVSKDHIVWEGAKNAPVDGKLFVEEASVTYVGRQDLNSIEVINDQNETEAMRLTEVAKPFFTELEKGAKITVFYVEQDGQKVIQDATRE
ncbi:BsuPI-related putative proteinase inhibitor [Paenisporosarcina indica]|uniref:BsuPI-related putative proteinase inhibitor n=1 Tax=Paenisporosarcina indica TaxID=650093 RepID=UPI00094FB933|nr:BsuPI-related putative proteinase inhibitor [Paenisporosarcina indica]